MVLCPYIQTRLEHTHLIPGQSLRLAKRPQTYLPTSFYPDSAHVSQAPPPYSSLRHGIAESTSHPLSMPVLVSGKEPGWKNQFGSFEVNHRNRVVHEQAGFSGVSGGGVERDWSVHGTSSSTSRRQASEVSQIITS